MFFLLKTQARFPASLAAKVHPQPLEAGANMPAGCCEGARVPAEGLKRCEAVPVPARSRERQRPGAKRCRDPEGVRPVASGGRCAGAHRCEIMRPRRWCSSCLKGAQGARAGAHRCQRWPVGCWCSMSAREQEQNRSKRNVFIYI